MTLEEAKIHALANTPTIRQLYIASALQGMLAREFYTTKGAADLALYYADAVIAAEKAGL